MNLIVAVDANWGIGRDNSLLVRIPEDMRFFRETTTGKIVVMGRRTLESFPGGRPLKDRVNIVLTGDRSYAAEGAVIVHDINQLKAVLSGYETSDVFVIGGGSVYTLLLPMCDRAYVTKVDEVFPADTFFPNLDENDSWRVDYESEERKYEGLGYRFVTYRRLG